MGLNSTISLLDSGQIVKRIYDTTNDAVRTVPAETTVFAVELDALDGDSVIQYPLFKDVATLFSAIAADTNANSVAVDLSNYRHYTLIITWATLDQTDATVKLQCSVDNSTWVDIATASITLNSAAGSNVLSVTNAGYKYFRAVYTKGTNTTGTVTAKYTAKS